MTDLICIGDSLTFGPGVGPRQKWTALAGAENRGVPGDTAAGILARVQPLLLGSQRPTVLLMGGTNDIFFSGSDTPARSAMAGAVHQLSAGGFRVLVGIPLPVACEDAPKKWAALTDFTAAAPILEGYCSWLKTFCAAFDIPVVDFRADFLNADGSVRRELLLDGLHPNAQGHARMAARLREVLK